MGECSIDDCTGDASAPGTARGWCSKHYNRWQRTGDPLLTLRGLKLQDPTCTVQGCSQPKHAHGFCGMHLYRWRRDGHPGTAERTTSTPSGRCRLLGCDRPARVGVRRLCQPHYLRWIRYGDPLAGRAFRDTTPRCTVQGCEPVDYYALGYCGRHYRARFPRTVRPGNGGSFCTPEQLAARLALYGGRCWLCRQLGADTVDHVKPRAAGGPDWPSNLRPAHRTCNARKSKRWPFTRDDFVALEVAA